MEMKVETIRIASIDELDQITTECEIVDEMVDGILLKGCLSSSEYTRIKFMLNLNQQLIDLVKVMGRKIESIEKGA